MSTLQQAPRLRSLYRRLLRELPARKPSLLANPSPIQSRIRSSFVAASPSKQSTPSQVNQEQVADQIAQYLKSQRMYITLIERYNPGMNMDQEERVRLSARRIGMELPIQALMKNKGSGGSGGDGRG